MNTSGNFEGASVNGTVSQSKSETQPPGWGSDKLSEFFEAVRKQQFATFANFPWAYNILREIDDCFDVAARNLNQPKAVLPAFFLVRSHSAYRAACATATAGQLPESSVLLRSSLEYAGYALHIFRHPALEETWLRRHDDAASLSAVRNAFSATSIEKTIMETEAKLGKIYKELYQRTIDFGGHPNERGVSSNMLLEESGNEKQLLKIYLHANALNIMNSFAEVARIGFCCLHIFQHIFKERFSLLDLKNRLFALREFEQLFRKWLQEWKVSNKGRA
jgi:hypothetical protein